jgi:hypothetical protein
MTDDILNLMEERRAVKQDPRKYQQTEKAIRSACKEAKGKWYSERCKEIEELENRHNMKAMHQKIKVITDRKMGTSTNNGCIRNKNGDLLFEKELVEERWTEYIQELYEDTNRKEREQYTNTIGPTIISEEVMKAIQKMKDKKAPGIDEIPTECLKALDNISIEIIVKLCNDIYQTGHIPQSVFIKIPKKQKQWNVATSEL